MIKKFNNYITEQNKFKLKDSIKSLVGDSEFEYDVYNITADIDGATIHKDQKFNIVKINKNEVEIEGDSDNEIYSINIKDLKFFKKI